MLVNAFFPLFAFLSHFLLFSLSFLFSFFSSLFLFSFFLNSLRSFFQPFFLFSLSLSHEFLPSQREIVKGNGNVDLLEYDLFERRERGKEKEDGNKWSVFISSLFFSHREVLEHSSTQERRIVLSLECIDPREGLALTFALYSTLPKSVSLCFSRK